MKKNLRIKKLMTENHVFVWQLADILGISESTCYRILRRELPEEEQDRICGLIIEFRKEMPND